MEQEVEVIAVGVESGEDGVDAPAVLLESVGKYVPIYVSPDQAQSIQLALNDMSVARPMAHDLLVEMIMDFGGAIDKVRIDDLSDGTFFAKIHTEHYHDGNRRQMDFDARPSDAIAIALRVECPITINEEVFTRASRSAEDIDLKQFSTEQDIDWEPS